jgi:hypothetical protein
MSLPNSSASAGEVLTQTSLPIELDFKLPASLPASKNYEIRVQPVNGSSFATAGSVISIDLPCGKNGTYLDPATSYLNFKVTYVHAGTAATHYSRLLGSAYSYFSKQEIYGNNSVLLESISELGVLANMLMNIQLNDSDKRGLSTMLGFTYGDTTANACSSSAGHRINFNATTEGLTFTYSIPILSGIVGSPLDKFLPLGKLYGLRYELTTDSFANMTQLVVSTTGIVGANKITSMTISDVEFVANIIELSPEAQAIIDAQNPQKTYIRTQSYRQASNNITSGTGVGTADMVVGLRFSSVKSIYAQCYIGGAGTAGYGIEGKFSGINPNLTQGTCFNIAGQNFPQRTLDPSGKPNDCFAELLKAQGSLSFTTYNSCINKLAYLRSSTANGLNATNQQAFTAYLDPSGNATTNDTNLISNGNLNYLAQDLEVVARKNSLLSGISTLSSPTYFKTQIGATLSTATLHTYNFWAFFDCILEIDNLAHTIVARY